MKDLILPILLPLSDVAKLSAENRKIFQDSHDLQMAKNLSTLLWVMIEKGFTSVTFYSDMYKDIDPYELKKWVEGHCSDKYRVEVMKNFFTIIIL